jgi:CheY-like chemotaxis protein
VSHLKKILYADDDLDDKTWVMEACKAIGFNMDIDFVENGRQALQYLEKKKSQELPVLIVLDLNMPELDGRQTLQRIKAHTAYNNIPVLIVTTSSNKVDMEICKRLGADLYLVKPDKHAEWQYIVRHFLPYVA